MQLDENGLTIDEACKVIHCSREWLRRKIHSGEIPAYRVGKGLRVTRAAISQVPPRRSPGDPT
ncbi:MAG: helix-turn-helix domain-containing protein [Coriobacteriia bacterium]|nr:helix-turn-helix domain-containing protein [Coriobacteriia bacterium]